MAKRGKGKNREGEWIESVTNDQSDFYPWKPWKYHPRTPGQKGRKSKVLGDRSIGIASLIFGLIFLFLTLVGTIQMVRNSEAGLALLLLLGGGGISAIFLRAAYEHFRFSAE